MADLTGRMIGAMQADVKTFNEIEADQNAMGQAITVIVIAGVASLIGNIFRSGPVAGVIGLIGSLFAYAVFALMVFLIGTKVMPEPATKADFNETFRVVGFAASPGVFYVLAIVPYLGPLISLLVGLWSLVIGVIAVREVLDYSNTGRAIIVALIAGVICIVIWSIVMLPILGAMFVARAVTG
ncbi:MAG TPA: YIP1 family protein [Vicinamibacterales bacterium]|nr:YIP1 family protein [Vicinamibacterales bacterium]